MVSNSGFFLYFFPQKVPKALATVARPIFMLNLSYSLKDPAIRLTSFPAKAGRSLRQIVQGTRKVAKLGTLDEVLRFILMITN